MFNFLVILLVISCAVSIAVGVNLRKWYGWVQVILGFVLGYFVALGENLVGSLITAIFFALLLILLGPIAWRRTQSNLSRKWWKD